MADVITRFRLETTQYDSKLRDATKELGEFTRQAEKAGSGFAAFTQASIEQARALGTIGTSATSAKDKVRELVSAYNDVARAYNSLSEEQQKTDFGKALSNSLQQLQTRISDAKREMADMGNQGRETGGLMGILADKLTVNVDAMKLFSMGMAAVNGALDVAKDAFFNNEEQLDEWGRVVESSHSLYQGFLNSLNTGDISGFLKNMGSIVQAARDAYDALDALGTYNAFNQINVEKTRTGMTESIADYRMGQGSKEDVKAAGEAYKNELKERKRLERDAYLAAVKEMAAQRGVSEKDLLDAMSGTYGHYQDLKQVQMTGTATRYTPGLLPGTQGTYTQYKVAQNDQERLGEALRHLNDTELKSLQALGAQAERTGNEIAQVDRSLARVLNGNRAAGGSRSGTARNGVTQQSTVGKSIDTAEKEYLRAIEKAKMEVEAGIATTADMKKKELQATESLWTAYSKAGDTVNNPAYKDRQAELTERIKALGGEVNDAIEAQKKLQEAARELESAQKKLADAQSKLADAQATGSATAIYKARENVRKQEAVVDRLRNPNAPVQAQPTGMAALRQSIQGELKFDQMKVDETTLRTLLSTAIKNGLDEVTVDYNRIQEKIAKGIDIPESTWKELQDEINAKLAELGIEPIKIDFKTGKMASDAKKMTGEWQNAASAIQAVGSAMSQIEDPMAKVMGTISQAVATVALSYAQAMKTAAETTGPWGWIAFAATGLATMISTISAIHAATGYSEGGMIKGNSYSNDRIMATNGTDLIGLNAGEIVLNRAQQNTLAAQLNGAGGGDGLSGQPFVTGDKIFLGINNSLKAQGKGEIVTTSMLRRMGIA